MRIFTILLVSGLIITACTKPSGEAETAQPQELTISFGSCAHSYDSMPIFNAVVAHDPDVWIWLGDIMYGDSHDMEVLATKYKLQKEKPEYVRLREKAAVIGIWDDHDYGINDGGKFYSKKDESKELLLDFLDVPENDPVREHGGVYSAHDYAIGDKLVKVILLDTRYFRDTLDPDFETTNRYLPNKEGDILGEEQWRWLEETLRNSKADFHILGSGIQVIPAEQGYEKWDNFPKSRQRLFDLLAEINPRPLMIISGDRHIAEISRLDIPGLSYPLYDFTSSGLTHTWGMVGDEPNQYRVGKQHISKNFGLINVTWEGGNPSVILEIRNENDELLERHKIAY